MTAVDAADSRPSRNGTFPMAGRVEIRAVGKTFVSARRRVRALSDISLTLEGGQVTAIVGPSGCGKSTLLLIAAGLEPPSDGQVLIDGEEIVKPYSGLGIAFQRDLLLAGRTVLDNVVLKPELMGKSRRDYDSEARSLLEIVGLKSFETFYPAQLSGGMRQRVSLCRALVGKPQILLLDEPFAAVDALTREDLAIEVESLFAHTGQPTTMLITHSIDEAAFMSERVYVMSPRPGRVVGCVEVDLPRPRSVEARRDPRFFDCVNQIRELLGHETLDR